MELRCPSCGGVIEPKHRLCPTCGTSLLIDVVISSGIEDQRVRFQAAKALSSVGPPVLSFGLLQTALKVPRSPIASSTTREVGQRCAAALQPFGVAVELKPPRRPSQSFPAAQAPRRSVSPALLLLLLASAAAAAWVYRGRLLGKTGPAGAAVTRAGLISSDGGRADVGKLKRSTVRIQCSQKLGSGFFVADGRVLTNAHVACPKDDVTRVVLSDGRSVLGRTLATRDDLDLALIEVSGEPGEPVELGDPSALRDGDPIFTVGAPLGFDFTTNEGQVSKVGRTMFGIGYLQLDLTVNPGNSGGPLATADGKVVGVVSMMVKDAQRIGLAVPITYAFDGEGSLLKGQPVPTGWAGFLAAVAKDDQRAVEEERRHYTRPGLIYAIGDGPVLVASLLIRSEKTPAFDLLNFSLERGGQHVCGRTQVSPSKWKKVDEHLLDPAAAKGAGPEQQQLYWMKKRGLSQNLYFGLIEVQWRECQDPKAGATLVLEDAEPAASRVLVELLPGADGRAALPGQPAPNGHQRHSPFNGEGEWKMAFRATRESVKNAEQAYHQARAGGDNRQIESARRWWDEEKQTLEELEQAGDEWRIPADWRH